MTRDEAVSEMKIVLGFRTGTGLDAQIIQTLKNAQARLERGDELPYFLRTEISSITTEIDEERIDLPDDFLREWEEDALWYFDANAANDDEKWTALQKDGLDFLRKTPELAGEGSPKAYAFDGKYFRLFPTPDAVYTLKMIYYATDTVLDTNIENKWLKHLPDLLIGEAGVPLATGMRDSVALAEFARRRAEGKRMLVSQSFSVESAGRRYVMGGEN